MSDINVSLRQINVPSDTLGRVNIEQVEPGRTAEIKAGISNIGVGYILILDGEGNPDVISPEEEHKRGNVGWDVKVVGGVQEREHIATFVLGAKDDKADVSGGHVPFECIRVGGETPGSAERTRFDVAHFRYVEGASGQAWFRQWRVTDDGVRHESEWLGASDGGGFRIGSQA
jgi:hypothetical protein